MKKIVKFSAMAIFALATLAMTGCDFLVGALLSVEGKVVNARAEQTATEWYKDKSSGTSLVGATVTLTNVSDASKLTATVDSTGKYSISSISPGRYTMSGNQPGWIFVPRTIDISGFAATMPDLLAYVNPGDSMILLITEWEERTIDVDMHLVIDRNNADTLDPTVTSPSDNLGIVNYSTPTATGVTLERDIRKAQLDSGLPAVETILISSNPLAGSDNIGWLRLYIAAWTDPVGNLTGNSYATTAIKEARATVHVMQGTTHLGTFKVATETQEDMICVAKIAVTYPGSVTTYDIMSPGNFSNTAKSLE